MGMTTVTIERLGNERLRALAGQIGAGSVWGSWLIPNAPLSVLERVFLPLGALTGAELQAYFDAGMGHVWEYTSQVGGRSPATGLPVFTTCKVLHHEDWTVLLGILRLGNQVATGTNLARLSTVVNNEVADIHDQHEGDTQ
jgi:hypothetical protein